jgi:glyoxylase-like metal-dependent hydrolase (beta-lactamase superfamily II)
VISTPVEKKHIEEGTSGVRVGRTVADGETLDLGGTSLEFIHAPGHTLGSLCIYFREQRILFTGDTVLGSSSVIVIPEQGDMGLYMESLHKLLTYESRIIAPGHGPVIEDPKANLERLIEHRLRRERQILAILGAGPSTIAQMFETMYAGLDPSLHNHARRQILSHLMKLEREGKVSPAEREGGLYTLTDGQAIAYSTQGQG